MKLFVVTGMPAVGKNIAAQVKSAGRLRLEGKEYIVQDGDIINFRFNV